MLHEYAVEPQAIGTDWQTLRYIVEKFGFDRGRLISDFPKHWTRYVYEAANGMSDIQKARVTEVLNSAKQRNAIVRFGRVYNPELGNWLTNALSDHRRVPFHAILAAAVREGADYVLCVDDIHEDSPLMAVPTDFSIARDVDSLTTTFGGLLRIGSRIVFVDAFFDPFNTRQKQLYSRCLNIIRNANGQASCEIHYRYDEDGLRESFTNATLEDHAQSLFGDIIPEGMTVSIFCWKEKDGGEDFHARYLLTEKGGIRVDAGFEPVGAHQHTDVTLMDLGLAESHLVSFSRGSTTYELVEPVIKVSRDGTVEHV
jgi:hypothetical protein